MKIHSIRLGHATNSSSQHSIIIWKGDPQSDDLLCGHTDEFNYGWETFTAASSKEKAKYLAVQFQHAMGNCFPRDIASIIIKDVTGITLPDGYNEEHKYYEDTGIDHQSKFNKLPIDARSLAINTQFYREFVKSICENDEILILGGNDNDGIHPLIAEKQSEKHGKYFDDTEYHPLHSILKGYFTSSKVIARKDKEYGFWTLFAPGPGTKIRIFLDDIDATVNQSSTPELIDLKITNQCTKNCKFCYQDSTSKGKHAAFGSIKYIIQSVSKMEVFEIALGGGEPTEHPNFIQIIKYIHENHMSANFSTGTTAWMNNYDIVDAVNKYCSAFAVSITTLKEMNQLLEDTDLLNSTGYEDPEMFKEIGISIHIPMGVMSTKDFEKVMSQAHEYDITVTLLGFKDIGRGKSYKSFTYDYINDDTFWNIYKTAVKTKYKPYISIDTALAQEWQSRLKKVAFDNTYDLTEGTFSCYIDACDMTMAASSYDYGIAGKIDIKNEKQYGTSISTSLEKVKETFSKIQDINLA